MIGMAAIAGAVLLLLALVRIGQAGWHGATGEGEQARQEVADSADYLYRSAGIVAFVSAVVFGVSLLVDSNAPFADEWRTVGWVALAAFVPSALLALALSMAGWHKP